jgi:hypothetical protein
MPPLFTDMHARPNHGQLRHWFDNAGVVAPRRTSLQAACTSKATPDTMANTCTKARRKRPLIR